MKYKTVVPPRVVMQTSPALRVVWFVLLFAAFVIATWFSYDYGRAHPPVTRDGAAAPRPADAKRLVDLESERDSLKKQVGELERDVHNARQALAQAQARISALQAAKSAAPPGTRDRKPAPTQTPTQQPSTPAPSQAQAAAGTPAQLTLGNLRISATESANHFRYSFSVIYPGGADKPIIGTIWVAVNGLAHNKPTRLSLKAISAERRPFVKMKVQGQQDVEGEITLPPDFNPKNIMIEAKPYDQRYQGAAGKFDWTTGG
jgi:hypothetical protein